MTISFLAPTSLHYPDEFNCTDTSRIEALPKDLLSALEISQKSDQGKVTVEFDKTSKYEDHAKNKDQHINKYTTNNYYITNGRKKSQQIVPPDLGRNKSNTCSIRIPCINDGKPRVFELQRALKLISKHTLNIIYGILGSIVATALTGAVYSIINSGSDTNNMSETFFTGIGTEITTKPTITNLLHSSSIQPTTNLGTQGLHNLWGWGLVSLCLGTLCNSTRTNL